jgi:DNA invertase Pin-like site-specific DNA recombinase
VTAAQTDRRAELARAIDVCRKHEARLVIAKLDRLSRNFAFVATLMDAGVEFVAVDNPHANKLTIQILAAVAEHEREAISERPTPRRAARSRRRRRAHALDPQGTTGAVCGQHPADHSEHPGGRLYKP